MKTAAFMLLLALNVGGQCVAGTTGVVNGYVRDRNGNAIANVTVHVLSATGHGSTHTDRHGFFAFLDLPPDAYVVDAYEPNTGHTVAFGVRVHSDQTAFLTFQLVLSRCADEIFPLLSTDQRAQQFISLDLRQIERYPQSLALSLIPMLPIVQSRW